MKNPHYVYNKKYKNRLYIRCKCGFLYFIKNFDFFIKKY